jgi:hypothetical protein
MLFLLLIPTDNSKAVPNAVPTAVTTDNSVFLMLILMVIPTAVSIDNSKAVPNADSY